jgi:hypothetical protein
MSNNDIIDNLKLNVTMCIKKLTYNLTKGSVGDEDEQEKLLNYLDSLQTQLNIKLKSLQNRKKVRFFKDSEISDTSDTPQNTSELPELINLEELNAEINKQKKEFKNIMKINNNYVKNFSNDIQFESDDQLKISYDQLKSYENELIKYLKII